MRAFPAAGTTSEARGPVARDPCGPTRIRGYLMIEALLALLIAACALGSLHALHITLARDSRLAAERAFASLWAEDGLEATLAALRAGEIPAGLASSWPLDATSPESAYWRRIELSAAAPGTTHVEVSVAWPHPEAPPPRRIVLSATLLPDTSADSGRIPDSYPPVISP